jgi:hypothetical protein
MGLSSLIHLVGSRNVENVKFSFQALAANRPEPQLGPAGVFPTHLRTLGSDFIIFNKFDDSSGKF